MNAQAEQYFNPIVGLPKLGLKQGDRIKVSCGAGYIEDAPDYIEVIEELSNVILCEYVYEHWMGYKTGYRHCLNKHEIATGAIKLKKEKITEGERK